MLFSPLTDQINPIVELFAHAILHFRLPLGIFGLYLFFIAVFFQLNYCYLFPPIFTFI
jgi:hypothetical protein